MSAYLARHNNNSEPHHIIRISNLARNSRISAALSPPKGHAGRAPFRITSPSKRPAQTVLPVDVGGMQSRRGGDTGEFLERPLTQSWHGARTARGDPRPALCPPAQHVRRSNSHANLQPRDRNEITPTTFHPFVEILQAQTKAYFRV